MSKDTTIPANAPALAERPKTLLSFRLRRKNPREDLAKGHRLLPTATMDSFWAGVEGGRQRVTQEYDEIHEALCRHGADKAWEDSYLRATADA